LLKQIRQTSDPHPPPPPDDDIRDDDDDAEKDDGASAMTLRVSKATSKAFVDLHSHWVP
jgi:hypothetical protein